MNKLVKRLVSGALSLVLVGALSVSAFAVNFYDENNDGSSYEGNDATTDQLDANFLYVAHAADIDVTYSWTSTTWTYLTDRTGGKANQYGTWVKGDVTTSADYDTAQEITRKIADDATAYTDNKETYLMGLASTLTITNHSVSYPVIYEVSAVTTGGESVGANEILGFTTALASFEKTSPDRSKSGTIAVSDSATVYAIPATPSDVDLSTYNSSGNALTQYLKVQFKRGNV